MISKIIRGGQLSVHAVRMLKQVFSIVLLWCACFWMILFIFQMYGRIEVHQIHDALDYYTAKVVSKAADEYTNLISQDSARAARNTLSSYRIIKHKVYTQRATLESFKVASYYSAFLLLLIASYFIYRGLTKSGEQFSRGAKFSDFKKLRRKIRRENFWNRYNGCSIAGMPYLKDAEAQHTLILGSTGTGKTVTISDLVAQIRKRGERAIIYDKKGDYVSRFYDLDKDFILNPFDKRSACWNLLPEIRHVGQIKTIVQSFIPDGPSSESRIWNEAARIALSGMLEKLMHADARLSNAEIANKILKANLKDVAALLKGTHARSTFDMSSPKIAASVMFVLSSHLNSLRLSKKQTEKSFSIRNWMESEMEDSFLFITSQASLNSELVPLQTAWYEIIINSVLSKEPSNASKMKKTWIIIDELGSMNKIPSLADGLSVARSFGGCFVLGTQNISQLRSVYGVDMAKSISSECNTRCIFRTNDPETTRWLSENIGDTETIEYKEGVSYGAHAMRDGVNLNMSARSKNLVMPSEIQNLADLNLFLKIPGHSIVKTSVKYEKYQQKAERFIEDTEMIASLQSDYTAADDEDEEMDDEATAGLDKVSEPADDLQRVKKKQKLQQDHKVTHKKIKQTQQNKEVQTLHTDKNNILQW